MQPINRTVFLSILLLILYTQGPVMAEQNTYKKELYASFTGAKALPMLPVEPISEEKAALLPSYLEAIYDCKGRMINLTKFVNSKIYFVQTIIYDENKISEIIVKDADGNILRKK